MKRPQATKATRAEVLLHISRQRALGQNLIPGNDLPSPIELIAVAVVVAAVVFARHKGWI